MTYEQKAKEIVGDRDEAVRMAAREYGPDQARRVSEYLTLMEEQITTALREAGNAKLEEAAQRFGDWPKTQFQGESIAGAIRAMKMPTPSLIQKD